MGYCAQFATYSMINLSTNKILGIEPISVSMPTQDLGSHSSRNKLVKITHIALFSSLCLVLCAKISSTVQRKYHKINEICFVILPSYGA